MSRKELTIPDLVLLSLLAERPMHGYEANVLLEMRKVREWAGVSRPQIYYSLEKLVALGLIEPFATEAEKTGPERRVYTTTEAGSAALADALERESWTDQLDRPPFLTWLALSWKARPGVVLQQLRRRREFVRKQLMRRERTLLDVRAEVGHPYHEAVWMLSLAIDQLRLELMWLERVERELPSRDSARNPNCDSE